jgi:NAD+-processing family protein with receiver domain
MAHRLWLDDERTAPWGYDLVATTVAECIRLLQEHEVEHVSLDHDMCDEHYATIDDPPPLDRSKFSVPTGYAVLEWMHAQGRWVADIQIHTLHPVGGPDMLEFVRKHAPAHVNAYRVKPWDVGVLDL